MITLYDYILSDDCYQIRLLLHMLGLDYEAVKVNIHPGRENFTEPFLVLSPLGRIPVLVDGTAVFCEPGEILIYLAQTYDKARRWFPLDSKGAAQVAMWLSFAAIELRPLSQARMANLVGSETEPDAFRAAGLAVLELLEDHFAECELAGQDWVACLHPTIADLALFPAVTMAPEGGFSLDTSPAVWRWIGRVKRLPGFIVMPGVLPLLS